MRKTLMCVKEAREWNRALVEAKRQLRALGPLGLLATDGAESLRVLIAASRKARGTAMYHAEAARAAAELMEGRS